MSLTVWLTTLAGLVIISASCISGVPLEHHGKDTHLCLYENKTYKAGEKFRPDPCTFCHCPHHGGRVLCAIQDCQWEPNCVRKKPSEDGCCSTCLEYGCKHRDGKIYHPREPVSVTPCEECFCPPAGGAVECIRADCPQTPNCVNPVQKEGDCCPTCPDGK